MSEIRSFEISNLNTDVLYKVHEMIFEICNDMNNDRKVVFISSFPRIFTPNDMIRFNTKFI